MHGQRLGFRVGLCLSAPYVRRFRQDAIPSKKLTEKAALLSEVTGNDLFKVELGITISFRDVLFNKINNVDGFHETEPLQIIPNGTFPQLFYVSIPDLVPRIPPDLAFPEVFGFLDTLAGMRGLVFCFRSHAGPCGLQHVHQTPPMPPGSDTVSCDPDRSALLYPPPLGPPGSGV